MKNKLSFSYALSTFILIFAILFSCLLGENIDFFAGYYDTPFSLSTSIVTSIVLMVVFVIYYILEFKKNKGVNNYLPLVFISLFFGLGIFSIWRMGPHNIDVEGVITVFNQTLDKRVIYTLCLIISFLLMFALLFVLPRRKININFTKIFCITICLLVLTGIIYSLLNEFYIYQLIFTGKFSGQKDISIKSFFNNKNVFAFLLMTGIFASGVMSFKKFHWWHYLYMLVFFVEMLLTACVTTIICSSLFILFFMGYRIVINAKKHCVRSSIFATLIIIVPVALLLTIYGLSSLNISLFTSLTRFINEFIFNKDVSTFTGRSRYWNEFLGLLDGDLDWVFGVGYKNFNDLFDKYLFLKGEIPFHSAESVYVQIIGSYGIIGLALYEMFLIYLLYASLSLCKHKKSNIGFISFALIICISIYGITENCTLFGLSMKGLGLTVLFVPILLSEFNYETKKEIEIKKDEINYEVVDISPISVFLIKIFTVTILISCSAFIFPSVRNLYFNLVITIILILSALLLFVPYLVNLIHKKVSKKEFSKNYFYLLGRAYMSLLIPLGIFILILLTVNFVLLIMLENNLISFMSIFVLWGFSLFIFTFISKKLCNRKYFKLFLKESSKEINNSLLKF